MEIIDSVVEDAFARLTYPSLEKDVRNHLTEIADLHAIEIFASNLRQLLLQPPFSNKIIISDISLFIYHIGHI